MQRGRYGLWPEAAGLDEMEFFRFSKNVWGQEMLLGMSWDPLWIPVAAAFAAIILHQIIRLRSKKRS